MGYKGIKALNKAVGESTSIICNKIHDGEISLLQKQFATNKTAFNDIIPYFKPAAKPRKITGSYASRGCRGYIDPAKLCGILFF